MNTLMFRGIDIKTGEWVYGGGIDSQRDTPIIINHGNRHFVDAESVGQATGAKAGRVNIYSGDILKFLAYTAEGEKMVVGKVHFCDVNLCWHVDGEFGDEPLCDHPDCEIIGNITQNPELLNM